MRFSFPLVTAQLCLQGSGSHVLRDTGAEKFFLSLDNICELLGLRQKFSSHVYWSAFVANDVLPALLRGRVSSPDVCGWTAQP